MNQSNENVRKKRRAEVINQIKLKLPSLSVNESLARSMLAVFCAQADPSVNELADIKCAVSEAVTNCIVHAYRDTVGEIYITAKLMLESDGEKSVQEAEKILTEYGFTENDFSLPPRLK